MNAHRERPLQAKGATPASPVSVSSATLFDGKREIIIEHGAERYRLQITASNKLILIK
ncbi:MAG: hemin uptake protein HemP [Parvibaculum sp.]|nr:hemin uptake protein HemP [Parvibaculum sp.]|tara:strand:- start:2278 stop:2451 length:174 start_codon:yes stop_codon:yes gene_type:complete